MNNDNFLIESSDIESVQELCQFIENPELRNRSVANVLGAKIASKYFTDYDVDTTSSLHNSPKALCDTEISDIYINNAYIDVRLYFNENEMCIPKAHFEYGITPVAYMFIKIDENITGGLVTGFAIPNQIELSACNNEYYFIKEEDLVSFYDVEQVLVNNIDCNIPENFETTIFDYLDGKSVDKQGFFKILLASKEYREFFINAANAKNVFNFISLNLEENTSDEDKEEIESNYNLLENTDNFEAMDLDESASGDLALETTFNELESFEAEDENSLQEFEENTIEFNNEDNITESIEEEEEEVYVNGLECENKFEDEIISSTLSNELVENTKFESTYEEDDEAVISKEILITEDTTDTENEETSSANADNLEEDELASNLDELFTSDIVKNEFDYTTETTPSLNSIEEVSENEENDFEELEIIEDSYTEETDENLENSSEEFVTDKVDISENGMIQENNQEQIDELFNDNMSQEEFSEEPNEEILPPKRRSFVPLIGTLALVAAIGYYGFNKINSSNETVATPTLTQPTTKTVTAEQPVAMPNESVENNDTELPTNEGNAISIPAIEKNLDASILVSNLTVNWEVPAGIANNANAQRYFLKIGKIIQLNLKTELLLLNKPPITNRIAVELEFDKNINKFKVKQITASSGESTVDDLIVQTIKKTLDMSLSSNMNIFNNITGNPILVIRM